MLAEHHGVAISASFHIREVQFKFWFQKLAVLLEIHSILTWLTMLAEFLCYFLHPPPLPTTKYWDNIITYAIPTTIFLFAIYDHPLIRHYITCSIDGFSK